MEYRRHNYHRKPRKKRQTKITIPSAAGPHVKLVFAEMSRQNVTYDEVEVGSGVLRSTLKAWRHKNAPGLATIEAVLGFLGWDLVPIPRAPVLPTALLEDLKPLAERHGADLGVTIAAFMGIAARERGSVGEALPVIGEVRPYPMADGYPPAASVAEGISRALKNRLPCAA